MSKSHTVFKSKHTNRRLMLFSGLFVLLALFLVQPVLADSPVAGAETCAECHEMETTAWQNSPHAHATDDAGQTVGATCEDCHGAYVEDHPEAGVMQLSVDSSVCADCHGQTFEEWKGSLHAEANVQCIGCHLSHSQEFRLTDDSLCGSCHRERLTDYQHTAHNMNDVLCTDCHVEPSVGGEVVMAVNTDTALNLTGGHFVKQEIPAPSHDFTSVTSDNCIECHQKDVHEAMPGCVGGVTAAELQAVADEVPGLSAKLEAAEEQNRSLQMATPMSLGLGMGIGGMLGIVFMLACGYINRKRAD